MWHQAGRRGRGGLSGHGVEDSGESFGRLRGDADLKRDTAILATSGRDCAERTKRLASRMRDLGIFSQGLVERESGGWKPTEKGRAVLEFLEAPLRSIRYSRRLCSRPPPPRCLRCGGGRAGETTRERRERRGEARERARPTHLAFRRLREVKAGRRHGFRSSRPETRGTKRTSSILSSTKRPSGPRVSFVSHCTPSGSPSGMTSRPDGAS